MAKPKKIILNSGPTSSGLPALTFAETGVSTDQNFVLIGTGTSNPHLVQTTHTQVVLDYSDTPGIIQNRYLANPLSTVAAPAYQTNKKSSLPSGICEPSDGDVGIVVKGVLIGRFTENGLQLAGSLSYDGSLGGVILSHGTTSQRPASPVHGFIWHNETLDILEWWDGDEWRPVGSGGGGSGLAAWEVVTANMTATAGQRIIANTDGGAFTITLPATPSAGDEIWIQGDFATNPLTIARNGKQIMRRAEDWQLNQNNIGAHLTFDSTINSWRNALGV